MCTASSWFYVLVLVELKILWVMTLKACYRPKSGACGSQLDTAEVLMYWSWLSKGPMKINYIRRYNAYFAMDGHGAEKKTVQIFHSYDWNCENIRSKAVMLPSRGGHRLACGCLLASLVSGLGLSGRFPVTFWKLLIQSVNFPCQTASIVSEENHATVNEVTTNLVMDLWIDRMIGTLLLLGRITISMW